jgi:hypothetical protein
VSIQKIRIFSVFCRGILKFLLKFLKRNIVFSKPQNWGKKVKKRKENLGHRPLFLSPIGQFLAHKENAAWMEDQNFRSHLNKKIMNENRNLFARYLWHVFGKTILETEYSAAN